MPSAKSAGPALALAAVLALAAGCGGGDETNGSPGGAGTDAQSSARAGESTTGPSGGTGGEGGAEGRGGEAGSGERPGGEGEGAGAERGGAGEQGGEGTSEGEGGAPGDEGSAPKGEGGAPSGKAAFVRRANEICARGRAERERELARYVRRNADKPRGERLEDSLKEVYVPGLEAQIAALRRLTPPPGESAEVGAIVEAMEGWVALVKRGGRSAKGEVDRALARTATLARRYGLVECVAA